MSDGSSPTVVCLGARGGCGASTLAGALALASAAAGRRPLLVDLDLVRGDLAAGWSIPAERSLDDLRSVVDELAPAHLARAAFPHPSGVAVIAAPPWAVARPWSAADAGRVLEVARAGWDGVVADLGAGDGRAAAGAVAAADRVVVVAPPTLAGARRARALLGHLEALGATAAARVVIGPVGPSSELGERSFGRACGAPVAATLPHSPGDARELREGRWATGRRRRLATAIDGLREALA